MLQKEAIKEFKEIYRNKFGIVLSDSEAEEQATKLVHLYQVLYKETTRE